MGLYGDLEPSDVPAYSKTEVALYLQLPNSTVGAWTRGTTYSDHDGGHVFFYPVIEPADPRLLSFRNLVELYVLKSLRRNHNVPLRQIRKAIAVLRERSGSMHPLADYEFLTDRRDIIIEEFGKLYNLNRHGQLEMGELLEAALTRVGHEDGHWSFRPIDSVVFSPSRQFGRPCIIGTRIPTELVYVRHRSGESIDDIAYDLECETALVSSVIEYERGLRAA